MRAITLTLTLSIGALTLAQGAAAQTGRAAPYSSGAGFDLAVTFTPELAKAANTGCGCFWLYGGSANVAYTFSKGLGLAADVTSEHTNSVPGGNSLGKTLILAGPRYTRSADWLFAHKRAARLFGEALFGSAHGFDSNFPSSTGVRPTANSFAMQAGGGVDLGLGKSFGLRLLEIDYVRSTLPNNGSGTQNDLRIAGGISFRMTRLWKLPQQ